MTIPKQRGTSRAAARGGSPRGNRRFYSVAEVAEILGMSTVTLYRAINDGEFPAIRIRGRVIIPIPVVDALVEGATTAGVEGINWSQVKAVR